MLLEKPECVQRGPRRGRLLFGGSLLLSLAVAASGVGFAARAADPPNAGGEQAVVNAQNQQAPAPAVANPPANENGIVINQAPAVDVQVNGFQVAPAQLQPAVFPQGQGPIQVEVLPVQGGGFQPLPLQMPGLDEVQKAVQKLQGATTPDEIKAAQQEIMKAVQKLQQQMPFGIQINGMPFGPQGPGGFGGFAFGNAVPSRLGASLEHPTKALVAQLNLPAGEGLVITSVTPGSAADKAGLKANDILLKLDGKAVPDQIHQFHKMLDQIKAETPVDAVVLRKGKEETVKGVTLPKQAPMPANPFGGFGGVGGVFVPGGGVAGGGISITRNNDQFEGTLQDGALTIKVKGAIDQNKAKVENIHIQDGIQMSEFKNLKDVPDQYRAKVDSIVEMVNKSSVQIQINGN